MKNVVTKNSELVKCSVCAKTYQRHGGIILQTPKGRFRLCKDCYIKHEAKNEMKNYKIGQKNIELYGLQDFKHKDQLVEERRKHKNNIIGI